MTGTDVWVADLNRIKHIAAGRMPEVLAVDSTAVPVLTADTASIYWASSAPSAVRKVPMAGGPVTTLIDSGALGAFAGAPGPMRVAPDGHVYWIASQNNVLSIATASASSSATVIAQGAAAFSDLAVDANRVYVAVPTSSSILTYPLSGGSPSTFAGSVGLGGPIQLALQGGTLYWLAGGSINKAAVAGGALMGVLIFDSASASGFTVDASNVYFVEPAQQEIRRSTN